MFKEKITQISGQRVLTNKGRVFESYLNYKMTNEWVEVKPPDFDEKNSTQSQQPKGTTKFVESVSGKEKFDNAKNINDLLND